MINLNPKGGTELQYDYLTDYVDKSILDQIQITTSVPEKIPLHPTKMNILWQKNSYDQPNLAPWFKDKNNHKKYDWYVFNSHWTYEKFRYQFDIPTEKSIVIKNGILPNVNYIGYKRNQYIKDHLQNYHMYAYPSIFEETFCISLLECMAAGLYCITTDLGALPETGAEFPIYIPYDKDYRSLAEKFAFGIESAAKTLHEPQIQNHLEVQSHYANAYYNWNKIGYQWETFLKGALDARSKPANMVYEPRKER